MFGKLYVIVVVVVVNIAHAPHLKLHNCLYVCVSVCVGFFYCIAKNTYHFVYHICARPSTTLSLFTPLLLQYNVQFACIVQYERGE